VCVCVVFSMIEIMEGYVALMPGFEQQLQHISGREEDDKMQGDSNISQGRPSYELDIVGGSCKMAMMAMMRPDSAAETDFRLADVVRKAATSVDGEAVVVEETSNSVTVQLDVDASPTTASSGAVQLVTIARQAVSLRPIARSGGFRQWCRQLF